MKRKREKRRSGPASDSPESHTSIDDDPLSRRFLQFADEARTYAGPLYETLSRQIARDSDLLRVARHVRRPPVPNVFLAAVHFLLAQSPAHALSAFYGSLTPEPRRPEEAYAAFRDFVLTNSGALTPLLEARITQTNEVGRCSFLLPAFTHVYRMAGELPVALIDVGCSAGLHLGWDRYHYDYGAVQVGDPRAAVSLRCELRGDVMPPLPDVFPACHYRLGIDLDPIDLTDPIDRRWFEALIWPEHAHRRRLARAAIDELLRDPPRIVQGDAADVLAEEVGRVPPGTLVVYNSAALCQRGAVEQQAIALVLSECSYNRPIHWLYCEGKEVLLRALDGGRSVETKLANKDGHGRWLEWLRS